MTTRTMTTRTMTPRTMTPRTMDHYHSDRTPDLLPPVLAR